MTLKTKGTLSQKEKQAHLEELVKRVPGVKGAHCVVMGKTAVVGIDVDAKLERARVGSIKYTVAEALRKDPHGAGSIVTADVDLNQRIAEIGRKVSEGHPVAGFATELADIIGRIMPQFPNDTVPRNHVQPGTNGKSQGNTTGTGNTGTGNISGTSTPNKNGEKSMKMAPGSKY